MPSQANGTPPPFRIAIMGAGIAGLSAALSLRHFFPPAAEQHHEQAPKENGAFSSPSPPPINIKIFEKASQLREIGASIALNPSGLRILDKLGGAVARNTLDPATGGGSGGGGIAYRQPSGHPMVYLHWLTNEVLAWDEYDGPVDERHSTARFHRAHLQRALLRALVEEDPGDGGKSGGGGGDVELRLGARAKSFEVVEGQDGDKDRGGGVVITFEDGTTTEVDLLIGADGIHSKVRRTFAPEHQLKWTGQVALRATFDAGLISGVPDVPEDAVHIVGHETTLFASYLGENQYTIVGNHFCDPDDENAPYHDAKWDGPGDVEFLKSLYKHWSPLVQSLTSTTPYIKTYPNYAGTPLPSLAFAAGRVVLLGDAAHTHGGAFAAGGSLAINDAYCLALALSHVLLRPASSSSSSSSLNGKEDSRGAALGEKLARASRLYDETRRPLVTRVLDTVHGNARAKKEAAERRRADWGRAETDEELRARVGRRPNLSWLTEHDVEEEFKRVVAKLEGRTELGI